MIPVYIPSSYLSSSSSSSSSSSPSSISSSSSTAKLPGKMTEQEIFETLSDKRTDDNTVADVFTLLYQSGRTDVLNRVVAGCIRLHGPGAITISDQVKDLLAVKGITLTQNEESGAINLHKPMIYVVDDDKGAIGSKKPSIEFSNRNQAAVFEALTRGSPEQKAAIIRQAVQQGQESYINQLIKELPSNGRLFLAGCDLNGLDLRKLVLNEAVLAGANLSNTNMSGLQLEHCNLNDANVDGADFSGSNLSYVSFVGGSAKGANFDHANLTGGSMDSTNFSKAKISNANCDTTFFVGATLTGADMRNSKLDDTNFSAATTTDVLFSKGFSIRPYTVLTVAD